jgi:3-deoxy-D-manno-octulosonic-acid transferase
VEAELWPNFLWQARRQQVPLFLVNARISERSWRGYKRFRFFFGPLFAQFKAAGCQSAADRQRLVELGFAPERVYVTGNLKFDAAAPDGRQANQTGQLLRQIGVKENAPVLVAGSTHPGEEAILADVFLRLRARFPELFLVVVPRHFERAKDAGQELQARGIRFLYRSQIAAGAPPQAGPWDCLLVNTTGELRFFYEHAAVVFIGKSLAARGGQNPIEPAALGKAMVFGPHMENFTAISRAFLRVEGAVQVQDALQLEKALADLLASDSRRTAIGARARQVVQENLGATARTVEMILQHFPNSNVWLG